MVKQRGMVFIDGTNVLRQMSKYLEIDYKAMTHPQTNI